MLFRILHAFAQQALPFFPGHASTQTALVPVYPHDACTLAAHILESDPVSSLIVEASKKWPPLVMGRSMGDSAKLVYIARTFKFTVFAGDSIKRLGSVDPVLLC